VDDKLTSRAKVIYERNNNSPLFLKVADHHLKNNNPHNAISIIENGLKHFPNHPLAFILLGRAQHLIGNIKKTESLLKQASEILNSNRTYLHYKQALNLIDEPRSPFDSSRGNIFMNSSEETIQNEEETIKHPKSVEDNLEQIAEELINTKIDKDGSPSVNETKGEEYNPDKSKLASETFANIYLSQGQKSEAIKVYEQLAVRNPEKREYYIKKIAEIKSQ
jgi:tetratricopeptide (TPR) repeat protein